MITGRSPATVAKLAKDEYVSLEILVKICAALKMDIGDIVEVQRETEAL